MKILLCAYHEAGYRVLRYLMERRHDVVVATHASSPEVPNVGALSRSYALTTVVDDPGALARAADRFKPDVLFSVYYRHIVSPEVLSLVRRGAYNFHPSLLPRHRGCFSAPWAIIEGDRETGVTCHEMTARVDTGDIIDQSTVLIDDADTGISLYHRLVDTTVDLFPRVLEAVIEERTWPQLQSGQASHHKRRVPYGGVINPDWNRAKIERFIRAMYFPPYPPAAVMVDGTRHPVRSLTEFDRIMDGASRRDHSAQPPTAKSTQWGQPIATITE